MNEHDKSTIRKAAEARLKEHPANLLSLPADEYQKIVHELQVHQIELEMQNEELHRVQKELLCSREEYMDLYDNAPAGYCTLDKKGVILKANRTLSRMLCVEKECLPGTLLYDYVQEAHKDTFFLHLRKTITAGERNSSEVVLKSPAGAELSARLESIPFLDRLNNTHLCRTIIQDITEEKKQTIALRNAMNAIQIAEESDRLKSAFLANMSHEIRTPLTAINGFSSLLLRDKSLSGDCKESLQMIRQSGKLLLRIINEILDISKIDAGQFKIKKESFLLKTLLHRIEKDTGILLVQAGKKVHINKNIPVSSDIWLYGDLDRIYQVILNLLNNAIKFTEEGFVEYGVNVSDTFHFYVKDTGPGIPEEKYEQVYKSFVRLEPSYSSKHNGTGLGLTIAKKISELLGGKLWFTSETGPGHGTSFHFTLPLPEGAPISDSGILEADHYDLKGVKVLVVEDNELNSSLFKTLLEKEGCIVTLANNGSSAIKLFRSEKPFSCIFMDIRMPGMDGFELCETIRQLENIEKRKKAVIIALTALSSNEDREKCFSAGMDDFICKPIESEDIMKKTIQKHLVRKNA